MTKYRTTFSRMRSVKPFEDDERIVEFDTAIPFVDETLNEFIDAAWIAMWEQNPDWKTNVSGWSSVLGGRKFEEVFKVKGEKMKRYYTIEETKKEEVFKMKVLKEYYPDLSFDFALPQPLLEEWAEWAKQWMPWVTYDLIVSSTAFGFGEGIGFGGAPYTVVSEVQAMLDAMSGKLNGYVSFYNGKQRDCWTETKAQAHELAVKHFQGLNPRKKVKSWDVTTMPAFIDGKAYINGTSF